MIISYARPQGNYSSLAGLHFGDQVEKLAKQSFKVTPVDELFLIAARKGVDPIALAICAFAVSTDRVIKQTTGRLPFGAQGYADLIKEAVLGPPVSGYSAFSEADADEMLEACRDLYGAFGDILGIGQAAEDIWLPAWKGAKAWLDSLSLDQIKAVFLKIMRELDPFNPNSWVGAIIQYLAPFPIDAFFKYSPRLVGCIREDGGKARIQCFSGVGMDILKERLASFKRSLALIAAALNVLIGNIPGAVVVFARFAAKEIEQRLDDPNDLIGRQLSPELKETTKTVLSLLVGATDMVALLLTQGAGALQAEGFYQSLGGTLSIATGSHTIAGKAGRAMVRHSKVIVLAVNKGPLAAMTYVEQQILAPLQNLTGAVRGLEQQVKALQAKKAADFGDAMDPVKALAPFLLDAGEDLDAVGLILGGMGGLLAGVGSGLGAIPFVGDSIGDPVVAAGNKLKSAAGSLARAKALFSGAPQVLAATTPEDVAKIIAQTQISASQAETGAATATVEALRAQRKDLLGSIVIADRQKAEGSPYYAQEAYDKIKADLAQVEADLAIAEAANKKAQQAEFDKIQEARSKEIMALRALEEKKQREEAKARGERVAPVVDKIVRGGAGVVGGGVGTVGRSWVGALGTGKVAIGGVTGAMAKGAAKALTATAPALKAPASVPGKKSLLPILAGVGAGFVVGGPVGASVGGVLVALARK